MRRFFRINKTSNQRGIILIEILVGVSLLSIIGLGIITSSIVFIKIRHKSISDALATQIALEELEDFAAEDPLSHSDGESWSETVTRGLREFTRTATVTVNSDNSRTLTVSVTAKGNTIGGAITMSNTYAPTGLE
ncbi:MAG: hypothetical protein D6719_13820 [Candidatus Dadabacteria bacterium]|nr:MAG: hypothetical protein D6719_13820 [Candidatus Dadabacteria bacterium]